MAKLFLGIGWAFPVAPLDASAKDKAGTLEVAEYEERVRQSIWIVLGTAKGERVMRPDFGCGIHDLVFEQNTPATAGRVAEAVRDALLSFEPRIEVLNVQVDARQGGARLDVTVSYQVRATNNAFNLVFPFYLQQVSS